MESKGSLLHSQVHLNMSSIFIYLKIVSGLIQFYTLNVLFYVGYTAKPIMCRLNCTWGGLRGKTEVRKESTSQTFRKQYI